MAGSTVNRRHDFKVAVRGGQALDSKGRGDLVERQAVRDAVVVINVAHAVFHAVYLGLVVALPVAEPTGVVAVKALLVIIVQAALPLAGGTGVHTIGALGSDLQIDVLLFRIVVVEDLAAIVAGTDPELFLHFGSGVATESPIRNAKTEIAVLHQRLDPASDIHAIAFDAVVGAKQSDSL